MIQEKAANNIETGLLAFPVIHHRRAAMFVMSRQQGNSIRIDGPEGSCLLTVLAVSEREVSLLISHSPVNAPRGLDSWTTRLVTDATAKIGSTAEITVVDIRADKVRLGVTASKESQVHRLEVYEALMRETRRESDEGEGPAQSGVPRPKEPKPPSLDISLDEPPGANEGE